MKSKLNKLNEENYPKKNSARLNLLDKSYVETSNYSQINIRTNNSGKLKM